MPFYEALLLQEYISKRHQTEHNHRVAQELVVAQLIGQYNAVSVSKNPGDTMKKLNKSIDQEIMRLTGKSKVDDALPIEELTKRFARIPK